MFWSGNYIVVRELNFLLKEENVTLSQVLEADDILQECKADNKNLMQFLTRPDILSELITLITEEPPQNVELTAQYRLASIACEVLTSDLSTLSDKLSMDVTQMNRLCDFIAKPPPLNPLLASYFSKTVEMLLERSTKQDWYLYHIVCLRVLDFFKSRRDFLPNLLRHMATSAIADTFKYFIRLDDLFNKIVMEWFEEHQLLESLIQVVCGGYLPEDGADEKGQRDGSEKRLNHSQHTANDTADPPRPSLSARLQAGAAANAAALLCDVIVCGDTRTRTMEGLVSRLQSEECVRLLLQSMFTSPAHARAFAVINGGRLLQALLSQDPILPHAGEAELERSSVELAVAPHLPLLHQALLQDPRGNLPGVGQPRMHLAGLVAQLARAEGEEICNALRALGTPGVLINMMFSYPHNNFLHGSVYTLVKHALQNRVYRTQYAKHLLLECDLLTRLMDVYEENESKKPVGDTETPPATRAAYMGHVIMMLEKVAKALEANDGELTTLLPEQLVDRWNAFAPGLMQLIQQRNVPLGGYYPSENIYEVDNMADNLAAEYEFHDMSGAGPLEDMGDDLAADGLNELHTLGAGAGAEFDDFANLPAVQYIQRAVSAFWERADRDSRRYDDDAWDDTPAADVNSSGDGNTWLPWEQEGSGGGPAGGEAGAGAGGAEWAQFDALPAPPPPVDPFAPATQSPPAALAASTDEEFSAFWPQPEAPPSDTSDDTKQLERSVQELQLDDASSVSLANNLLTAMSALPPDQLATIVGAGADVGPNVAANVGSNVAANVGPNVAANVGPNVAANDGPNITAHVGPNAAANDGPNITAHVGPNAAVNIGPNVTAHVGPNAAANVGATSVNTDLTPVVAAKEDNEVDVGANVTNSNVCDSNVGASSNCDSNVDSNANDVGSSSHDVGSTPITADTASSSADTSCSADTGTSADCGSSADTGADSGSADCGSSDS